MELDDKDEGSSRSTKVEEMEKSLDLSCTSPSSPLLFHFLSFSLSYSLSYSLYHSLSSFRYPCSFL